MAKEKEQRARALYMRKRDQSLGKALPPDPMDDAIRDSSVAVLKEKWNRRTKIRQDCRKLVESRVKDLTEFKKERNVLQRKEGEVWKCGEAFKMEWTHSPL